MKTSIQNWARESTSQPAPLTTGPQAQPRVDSERHPTVQGQLDSATRLGHQFARTQVTAHHLHPKKNGKALPPSLRTKMERAFRADFSDVRVHLGSEVETMGAVAFTQGSDIHFSTRSYRPESRAGQALVRHELTHVLQQRAGRVPLPRDGIQPINSDRMLEREADLMAQGIDTTQHSRGAVSSISGSLSTIAPTMAAATGAMLPIQMAKTYYGKIKEQEYYYDDQTGKYYDSDKEDAKELAAPNTEYEVGAGDFSAAAARHRENPDVLRKVTTFESEQEVMARPGARGHVEALRTMGASVQFDVDATKFHGEQSEAKGKTPMSPRPVRRVRFEYPHTGSGSGSIDEQVYQQERNLVGTEHDPKSRMRNPEYAKFVHSNRQLVSGFLSAAPKKGANVNLTYKRGSSDKSQAPKLPYADWEVEQAAAEKGLALKSMTAYEEPVGYVHVRTNDPAGRPVSSKGSATLTYRGTADPDRPTAQRPIVTAPQQNVGIPAGGRSWADIARSKPSEKRVSDKKKDKPRY